MSKIYKIWVEVEEIDEENDTYETIEGHEIEVFENEREARTFAANMACSLLNVPMEKK